MTGEHQRRHESRKPLSYIPGLNYIRSSISINLVITHIIMKPYFTRLASSFPKTQNKLRVERTRRS